MALKGMDEGTRTHTEHTTHISYFPDPLPPPTPSFPLPPLRQYAA